MSVYDMEDMMTDGKFDGSKMYQLCGDSWAELWEDFDEIAGAINDYIGRMAIDSLLSQQFHNEVAKQAYALARYMEKHGNASGRNVEYRIENDPHILERFGNRVSLRKFIFSEWIVLDDDTSPSSEIPQNVTHVNDDDDHDEATTSGEGVESGECEKERFQKNTVYETRNFKIHIEGKNWSTFFNHKLFGVDDILLLSGYNPLPIKPAFAQLRILRDALNSINLDSLEAE